MAPIDATFERIQELETVHLRHHQVEQDQGRRWILGKPGEGQAPVCHLCDRQSHLLDRMPHRLARRSIIFDQEDRTVTRQQIAQERDQLCAIDRLGHDFGSTERKPDAAVWGHGDHDNGYIAKFGVRLECAENGPAIRFRH